MVTFGQPWAQHTHSGRYVDARGVKRLEPPDARRLRERGRSLRAEFDPPPGAPWTGPRQSAVFDRRSAVAGLARTMGCDDPLIPWAAAYCLANMRRGMSTVVVTEVECDDAAVSAQSTLTSRPSMIGGRLPCSDNDVICTSTRLARSISFLRFL